MKHLVQDIECPSCTTLAGPCATTQPARVAWPVFVLEGPVSMSKLVRVARALKVLYGGDIVHKQTTYHHVWFTPGPRCNCDGCHEHLDRILRGPHDALQLPGLRPAGSIREFLDRRRERVIGPEEWPTEQELRDDLTRPKTGNNDA